jgi:ribonuclease T2
MLRRRTAERRDDEVWNSSEYKAMKRLARMVFAAIATAAATLALATPEAAAQRRYDDRYYDRDSRGGNRYDDRNSNRFDGGAGSGRNVAGQFDYYALVMSWSPTHCASEAGQRADSDTQCERRDGRRYAFVLHGLWPQYERGFPDSCPTRDRPFVPDRVIESVFDVMPSRGLAIHEYRKHGTCSGLDPAGYFDLAEQLFRQIRIPERYVNPFDGQNVAPEEFVRELTEANPGLQPDMMGVVCGGPGNRLKEVRVCFTRQGKLRACGKNESQKKLCSARQMFVPPVRSSAKGDAAPPQSRRDDGREPARDGDRRRGGGGDGKRDFLPGPRGI